MNKYLMTFLGVTALVLSSAFAPLPNLQNATAASDTTINTVAATSTDPTFAYTVQPGDTLSALAQAYNTTVAAIQALNPQITDPNLIYSGEVILIPSNSTTSAIIPLTGPSVTVTPSAVEPGSSVAVEIASFPTKTPVLVSLHPLNNSQVEITKDATTNASGNVTVDVKLPSNVSYSNDQTWVATVSTTSGTSLSAISNGFVVNPSAVTTSGTATYIVQPGDDLAMIAQEFGTTEAEILALNPQITGSDYLYAGEPLIVPSGQTVATSPIIPLTGSGPSVLITPDSGPQGTFIDVILTGFPADTSVDIGLHKLDRQLIESHASATTDAYGQATVTMRIPTGSDVNNNRVWLAQVSTNTGPSLTVSSNPFDVTGQ